MNSDTSSLSVGGYLFYTEKDAQLARAELKKIEYLEARIDYSAPESIHYIYDQTIRERLFRTPVGWKYLERLHDFLLSQPDIAPESVIDIPLYLTFDGEVREQVNPARERVVPSKKRDRDKEKERFLLSVVLNVLLAAAIVCMFVISFVPSIAYASSFSCFLNGARSRSLISMALGLDVRSIMTISTMA